VRSTVRYFDLGAYLNGNTDRCQSGPNYHESDETLKSGEEVYSPFRTYRTYLTVWYGAIRSVASLHEFTCHLTVLPLFAPDCDAPTTTLQQARPPVPGMLMFEWFLYLNFETARDIPRKPFPPYLCVTFLCPAWPACWEIVCMQHDCRMTKSMILNATFHVPGRIEKFLLRKPSNRARGSSTAPCFGNFTSWLALRKFDR
jgi:hypothetical protein